MHVQPVCPADAIYYIDDWNSGEFAIGWLTISMAAGIREK